MRTGRRARSPELALTRWPVCASPRGDKASVLRNFRTAWRLGDPRLRVIAYERALLLRAIAEVRRHQRRYGEARRILRQSEAIVRRLRINDFLPAVLSARGFLEVEAGRSGAAETALREALRACSAVGEKVIRSDVVYKLAEIAYGRGDLREAGRFVREAIELNEPIGDPVWCRDCHLLAAAIANDAGDVRAANAAAAKAARWARRIPRGG